MAAPASLHSNPSTSLGCFGLGWANFTSLLRMFLALGVVLSLLYLPSEAYWWPFLLTVIVIWLDGVDGYLARRFNESSSSGAVIDILSDRCVELFYWIGFAVLGWIPLWMTLGVVMRGIWVDGLRALALQRGYTAFGSTSLMQHPLGVLLVSSRFSRWTYAACKALGFSLLVLSQVPVDAVASLPLGLASLYPLASATALPLLWITFIFCWLRGLPVLIEGHKFWSAEENGIQ